jgi:hypothetical protein
MASETDKLTGWCPTQTAHLRLLNAFVQAAQDLNMPKEHELSAHQLHVDLFLSGIERILLVRNPPPSCFLP